MPYGLFICSLVEGHLDCFQVLGIVSITAINICVQVLSEQFSLQVGKFQAAPCGSCEKSIFSCIRHC